MAALTQDRKTDELLFFGSISPLSYPVEAATQLFGGSLGCFNAAGNLTKGAVSTTLVAAGRIERGVNNTGAAGAVQARYKPGVFLWLNSTAGDLITAAFVGTDCFIVDDQTVAKTNGTSTRSRAGRIVLVTSAGVYVGTGFTPVLA